MDDTVSKALRAAAEKAGIIDLDALGHPLFAKIIADVKSAEDVPRAIDEMRKIKPAWYSPQFSDKMTNKDFDRGEAALREHRQQRTPPIDDLGELLGKIDASQLDSADFAAYELAVASFASSGVLRSFIDRSAIRRIVAAQGIRQVTA